jgi:hypothetical protein
MLLLHENTPFCTLAYSRDGRWLAAGGGDESTGGRLLLLNRHSG